MFLVIEIHLILRDFRLDDSLVETLNELDGQASGETEDGAGLRRCKAKGAIGSLPFRVCRQLMIMLNPRVTWKGDFRDLSGEMGFTWDEIIYFQSLQNPMDAVLTGCRNVPIEQLMVKLEKIGRPDARSVVEEYITESCKCKKCND